MLVGIVDSRKVEVFSYPYSVHSVYLILGGSHGRAWMIELHGLFLASAAAGLAWLGIHEISLGRVNIKRFTVIRASSIQSKPRPV